MARVLKLVKGATTLNLLNNTDGISLRSGGDNWQPVYPIVSGYGEPEPVVETMRLQCRGTSQNAIAGTMQIWADMMRGASIYRTDANGTAPVWLHAKLDDETNERRSIVHRIDAAWVDSGMTEAIDQDVMLFDAAIERGPYWEATTPTAMGTMVYTNLLSNGGFETAGAGGADVFGTWEETAGDGSIAAGTAWVNSGSYAAQLTAGASTNTKISQTITVEENTAYALVFSTSNPNEGAGRYGIYDASNAADIVAITTVTATATTVVFESPAGCTSVRIDLWCPGANGVGVSFDDVAIYDKSYAATVQYDYTANGGADVPGDVPARVSPLTISQQATNSNEGQFPITIYKMWAGVRSETRHPGVSGFVPVWECEDGVAGTSTAGTADASASGYAGGNSAMRVTPGTATWAARVTGMDGGVGTANFGDYLWLLRARVSAGTYEIKLRWSTSSTQYIEGPTVEVTNTAYMWQEMGVAPIPLVNRQSLDTGVFPNHTTAYEDYYIDIWGRRTSGSGTLDLDCLGLVPIDEGWLVIEDVNWPQDKSSSGLTYLVAAQSPRGAWRAATVDHTYSVYEEPVVSGSLQLPPGDGRLVIFANGATDSNLAPFLGFQPDDMDSLAPSQYYPRWLSLRGAE